MNIKKLIEESKNSGFGKGKNLIKPFGSLVEVLKLLEDEEFQKVVSSKKLLLFIRKKVFWIIDKNEDVLTLKEDFKLVSVLYSCEIAAISDQILLTYFEEELTFLDLESIISRLDDYNSLTAYKISSGKDIQKKAVQN